jgi:translation initiation factor IF-3
METVLMDYGKYLTLESGKDKIEEYDKEIQKIKNVQEYKYIVTIDNNEHILTVDENGKLMLTPPVEKRP